MTALHAVSSANGQTLTTDKQVYLAEPFHYARPWRTYRYRASVITKFRNPLKKSVFLDRCNPMDPRPIFNVVAVDADKSWDNYAISWMCNATLPIEVRAGETKVDTLMIEGPNSYSHTTGTVGGRLGGVFKIELYVRECGAERCALIDSLRYSNSFAIRRAEGQKAVSASLAGCYMLGWVPGIEQTFMFTPPRKFRLYQNPRTPMSNSGPKSVRPLLPLGDSSTAHWIQFGQDSLFVSWAGNFSGYRLHLRPDGGLLYGLLEVFALDRIIPERFTDAVARRVDCDKNFRFL